MTEAQSIDATEIEVPGDKDRYGIALVLLKCWGNMEVVLQNSIRKTLLRCQKCGIIVY